MGQPTGGLVDQLTGEQADADTRIGGLVAFNSLWTLPSLWQKKSYHEYRFSMGIHLVHEYFNKLFLNIISYKLYNELCHIFYIFLETVVYVGLQRRDILTCWVCILFCRRYTVLPVATPGIHT